MRKLSKKMNKILWLVITALSLVFVSIALFIGMDEVRVEAEDLTLAEDLNSDYLLDSMLQLPSGQIEVNGTVYETESMLYYPDNSVQQNSLYLLNLQGVYKAVYYAKENSNLKVEKIFSVYASPYYVPNSSKASFVDILKTQTTEDSLVGGISVELAQGAEFIYKKPIDLNEIDDNQALIRFTPYQSTLLMTADKSSPALEVGTYFVRLTDAYDNDNYIDIRFHERARIWKETLKEHPYITAAANGQTLYGLDDISFRPSAAQKIVNLNGQAYNCFDTAYGTYHGNIANNKGGSMSIYYNEKENRLSVGAMVYGGESIELVNDFDSSSIYPDTKFSGFTTGEVYVSIRGDNYEKESMHIEITELDGKSGANLNEKHLQDNVAPKLVFENSSIPNVVYEKVGNQISIPNVFAFDINMFNDVKATVYYGYGTNAQSIVNVRNGKCTLNKIGKYTILYMATDAFGNQASKTITVNSVKENVLNFSVDEISNMSAGQYIVIPEPSVTSRNDDVYYNISIKSVKDGTDVVIGEDRSILLSDIGDYEVTYYYGDAFIHNQYTYTFKSECSDNIYIEEMILPEYFIKDARYTLDDVKGYSYEQADPALVSLKAYINEDNTGWEEFNPKDYLVGASNTVQIKYIYNDKKAESAVIPVVDVQYTKIKKSLGNYFVGDIETTVENEWITLSTKETVVGDVKIEFANAISFSSFAFQCSIPHTANYDSVELILMDYYDRKVSLSIIIAQDKGEAFIQIGNNILKTNTNFFGGALDLKYNNVLKTLMTNTGRSIEMPSAFTSDKILFDIVLHDVEEKSDFQVSMIGNQRFNNNARDIYEGKLIYDNNASAGLQEFGSIVTISKAYAIDVLSPFSAEKLVVSVMTPSDDYAVALDGTVLDQVTAINPYSLKLNEYGEYIVKYSYVDGGKNETTGMYLIDSKDLTKPVLTINGGYNSSTIIQGVLGKNTVAGYSIQDNIDAKENLKVDIFVYGANGKFILLEDNTFVAEREGRYLVMYYCVDSSGNYVATQYTIQVS